MQHRSSRPSDLRHSALAIALAAALGCSAVPALAQSAPADIHIPAQDLGPALDALAAQAGIRLLYSPDAVKGHKALAVDGRMDPETALARLLAGSGLTWTSAGGAYAVKHAPLDQESAAEPKEMEPLVVTATRTEQRITDVPASVSVITAKDLATQQPQVIGDLLRNVEGVDVAGTPNLGASDRIVLRGVGGSFSGATSQILQDGMPTESPLAGIHLGMKALDVQDVERIEIVRGPASALYGPSAVGGVINLIPKRWRGAPGAEISLGAGSHDSARAAAAAGFAGDAMDLRLSASDYRTNGYVAQPDPDPAGGRDLTGRSATERRLGLSLGLRPSASQEITLAVRNADIDADWLGGHPNFRINDKVESLDPGYRHELGDRAVLKARYRQLRQQAHLLFDDEFVNGNPGSLALAEVDQRTDDTRNLELQADLQLAPNNLLTLGYSHGVGKYLSSWTDILYGGSGESVWESRVNGVFLQDEHRFANGFTLFAGGRWDRYSFFGDRVDGVATGKDASDSVFNPRLGARYRLAAATSVYATAGTAYVPALNMLRFGSNAMWLDNPDLQPETSTTYELGLDHAWSGWKLRTAVFHTDYKDKISSLRVGSQWQYQNIGKVQIDGLELALEGKLAGGWQPYLNYAYTDSRIVENPSDPLTVGKEVQRVAPHKLNLGLVFAPSSQFYARLSGRYGDGYYFNDRNTADARNPARFVADFKTGWRFPLAGFAREGEFSVAINNLLDRRYREQQYEYMDGRNVWFNLQARF